MTPEEADDLRRLLEMAYLHCHGPGGDGEKRNAWQRAYLRYGPDVGRATYYAAQGKFVWEKWQP